MENLAPTLQAAAAALAVLGGAQADIDALDDAGLIEAQRTLSALQRATQPYGVGIATALARRSERELGYAGLARKNCFPTPESLPQSVSGMTKAEAVKLVQLGAMLTEVQDADPGAYAVATSWAPIVHVVNSGELSIDAADSIRKGLDGIDDRVASEDLRGAARRLVAESTRLDADQLFRRARELRDEHDAAGGSYVLSDEDGELMLGIYDRATSPRRNGPRFADPLDIDEARRIDDDPRTNGQLAADTIAALLRLGLDADPNTVFGARRPAVRVVVAQKTRRSRVGHGSFESGTEAISLETVNRFECEGGTLGLVFDDDGRALNLGRTTRTFAARQRIVMAVRDGGCRFPGCERPVSWCEAHHIDEWLRDHGETNVDDGILLCRTHHMLIHDNHWRIVRTDGQFWARPPRDVDPERRLIAMPSGSAIMRELLAVP